MNEVLKLQTHRANALVSSDKLWAQLAKKGKRGVELQAAKRKHQEVTNKGRGERE